MSSSKICVLKVHFPELTCHGFENVPENDVQALLNGFDDILVDSTTLSDLAWQEFLNQMNVNYGWP